MLFDRCLDAGVLQGIVNVFSALFYDPNSLIPDFLRSLEEPGLSLKVANRT
jgi:hypothetical protein